MKPPPPGLPAANSRKWHGRRLWDALGYLRVRSLANPRWSRDIPWLVDLLRREAEQADPGDRLLYEQAITAAQRYKSTSPDATKEAWDQVLIPIDEILTRRQSRHLADARRAQPNHEQDSASPPEPLTK